MRYGFILPGGSATEQVEAAVAADRAGWDGVFVWEGGYALDPWALLAAMAVRTEQVRLGTMLTPLPWRRPWKVAAQVATIDQLSEGRVILTVGLGAVDPELGSYPEETDLRARAALLDEGIDLMTALWSGARVVAGDRWPLDLSTAARGPLELVQHPRPPLWVVAAWPSQKSMRRALRCDGLVPQPTGRPIDQPMTPDELRLMLAWYDEHGSRPADVVHEGETEPGDGADAVAAWADAGATWWLESRWTTDDVAAVRARIDAGPPRP